MTPRPYHSPARDEQTARTREAILRALADVVVEHGVADLAVQQVADRAGVSHRTVYRHFPDRQALLDALGTWVQQQLMPEISDRDLGDVQALLAMVPRTFARFDDMAALVAAMARISAAEGARAAEHRDRTGRFRRVLAPALAGYDDPDAVFAVLRHLLSALTWWVLRTEFGLDGGRAGRAVAAVVDAVLTGGDRSAGEE